MSTQASQIQIPIDFWNEHYILGTLNIEKQLIHYNELFQSFLMAYSEHFTNISFEQLFIPYDVQEKHFTLWEVVWSQVEQEGFWIGYLTYVLSPDESAKLDVTIIHNIHNEEARYFIIAKDKTKMFTSHMADTQYVKSLENMKDAFDEASIIAVTDSKGVIIYVNDMFCLISKYNREELLGKTHRVINSKHHPKSFFVEMWDTIQQGKVWRGEVKNRAKDGSHYWMNTTIVPFLDQQGKPYQYVSVRSDITDRVAAENELAKILHDDFRRTIKNLQNCIFKLKRNDQGHIIFTLNEGKIAEQLRITTDQVENMEIRQVWREQFTQVEKYFERAFNGCSDQFEMRIEDLYYYVSLSPVMESCKVIEVVGSMIDITERKKAEQTIHYMAHYDALTNLPNRTSFTNKLTEVLNDAKEYPRQVAVLYMDLDRFKTVNDTMGHSSGDLLLKMVADRLQDSIPEQGYVSRQGGDEFTLFLDYTDHTLAKKLALKINEVMSKSYMINETELYITPSIGISMFPEDGSTIDILLKNADSAMYAAKEQGKNNHQFFTKQLHNAITSRLELERDLRKALEKNELELWYQPKINLISNELIGVEALLRWNHPIQGMIPPNNFINIAEETNLIIPIGKWVLYEACRQMKKWVEQGIDHINVAVNISLKQFSNDDFLELIARVLCDTELDPQYLELEITESVAQNAQHAIKALSKIKELGVSMSIDDFGTGYSSLSYLSQFPIDRLKIDQSFVRNLNDNNQAIIRTILDIANHMGITVIAEGVESLDHVEFLKQHNCQEAQGYFYSKPMPSDAASSFISDFAQKHI